MKGELFTRYSGDNHYYIPKVMCGEKEICQLVPFSFPIYKGGVIGMESAAAHSLGEVRKVVIEKNHACELLTYFADGNGSRLTKINGGTIDVVEYVNSVLKQYCSKILM